MAEKPRENLKLIGDMPIFEATRHGATGEGIGPDKLNFNKMAEVLAGAAVESHQPINIGVYGKWGTGKTSLTRLMMEKVQDPERPVPAIPVWFNAWQYEREEHLIVPLIATINREIERAVEKMENGERTVSKPIIAGARDLYKALRSIAYGFAIKGKVGIPMMGEAEVNLSGKDMISRYQELTKDSVLARSLYFDAFEELRKLSESGKVDERPRIVVFVDDLDRCFPDKAVELLEGIKLVLHQPGFSFVLGVNELVIREYIKTKYHKDYNISIDQVDFNYLEKIVQVEVRVPEKAPDAMQDYIRHLLEDAGMLAQLCPAGEDDQSAALFSAIAIAGRQNPREIVRRLNKLILVWRLQEDVKYGILDLLINDVVPRELTTRLEYPVGTEDAPQTLANLILTLVEKANQDYASPEDFGAHIKREILKNNALAVGALADRIRDHEWSTTAILRTDAGRKWLGNKELRSSLAKIAPEVVSERTSKPSDISGGELIRRAIREIEQSMVDIPGGKFTMGKRGDISISPFRLSKYPVTQEIYEAIMGPNPSGFIGPRNPVENVSWLEALECCKRLSELTGKQWRLPTEAQWEYACRAGSQTAYCFGDSEGQLKDYAWFDANSEDSTHPVGEKNPNEWGLHDMHGNVWEWCADWYGDYIAKDLQRDPTGPGRGVNRVVRGGSWKHVARNCRSAHRSWNSPDDRISYLGFRFAQVGGAE